MLHEGHFIANRRAGASSTVWSARGLTRPPAKRPDDALPPRKRSMRRAACFSLPHQEIVSSLDLALLLQFIGPLLNIEARVLLEVHIGNPS